MLFFLWSRKTEAAGRFYSGAENRACGVRFFWSKRGAVQCVFGQSSFFSSSERRPDLSVCKRDFFEDSFRVRSSSICLDLRLDLPIILFTIFG